MMEQQNWQVLQERIGWLNRQLKFTLILAVGGLIFCAVIWMLLLLGLKYGFIQLENLKIKGGLAILDKKGRHRIELAIITDNNDPEGVAGLALTDVTKKKGIMISVSSTEVVLSLNDKVGPRTVFMITSPYETPALTFYSTEGKLCAELYVDPKGVPKLRLLDTTKGHVLFKVP